MLSEKQYNLSRYDCVYSKYSTLQYFAVSRFPSKIMGQLISYHIVHITIWFIHNAMNITFEIGNRRVLNDQLYQLSLIHIFYFAINSKMQEKNPPSRQQSHRFAFGSSKHYHRPCFKVIATSTLLGTALWSILSYSNYCIGACVYYPRCTHYP